MYPQELVNRLHAQGWNDEIGGGCYAKVYANHKKPDWVVKVGTNDGTRTYLEWVMLKRAKGEFMKGMPLVDWVVPIGERGYMVSMKRYKAAHSYLEHHGKPRYINELRAAFEHETGVRATDVHNGNIMWNGKKGEPRENNLVLTDPSTAPYTPLGETTSSYYFELEAQ